MKKLIFIFCLFLSIGLQAQTVSISCETCQWLKSSDCDVCSSVYKSKMFRGGLKIKKLGKTMYFEHPLSIELVNSKFKMTDANGQKFDFYLNETSFNTIGALKSFIALCACSAPSDTSTVPQIVDTDRRLTELAFVGDSLVATVRDINNNIAAVIVLDNAKGTTTPCRDSVWKVVDTIFHQNVFCNIQKITMSSSKANGFFQLTTLADTSLYTTQAQTQCPSPSFAKLDSCNISYLFIYDCNAGNWFIDSANIREYKDKEFLITQKYKYFNDNTGIANTSNPAYQRQLGSAKMGCDHCPFPSIMDAVIYAQTNSIDTLDVELSAETYKETGVSTNPLFGNFSSFKLNTRNSFLDVSNSNQPLYSIDSDTYNSYNLDIDNLVGINCTQSPYPLFSSRNEGTGELNLKIKNLKFYPTQSTRLFGAFLETKGNTNVDIENVDYKAGSFLIVSNGGEIIGRKINKNYKIRNLKLTDGTGLYIRRGQHETNINCIFENVTHYKTGTIGLILGTSVDKCNLISKLGGGSFAVLSGNNSSVYFRCNNYSRLDSITDNYGIGVFDNAASLGVGGHNYSNAVVHFGQVVDEDSLNYFFELDNVNTNDEVFVFDGSKYSTNPTIYNSTVKIVVKNCKTKARAINISNINLVNTKVIIEGDFEAKNKCVTIYNNTLDATSSIQLKGKFKTTSTTLEAIEIGNNSGTGVNNIIIDGQIITGGGFSIDNPLGIPINVIVKPGCASNVTTSANVTQLGTGIYVDPNFNN